MSEPTTDDQAAENGEASDTGEPGEPGEPSESAAAPSPPETPPAIVEPAWKRLWAFIRALDFLPRAPTEPKLSALLPKTTLQWISVTLLWTIFFTYLRVWYRGHLEWLYDGRLQPDDVRTAYLIFHNWTPDKALISDPLTQDMKAYVMPGLWLLTRITVPIWGVFLTPKVMQLLCLIIAFVAGLILLRSRRGGLASAVLMVFFILHTPYFVNRMAGGMGRGFAFPLFALWTAGAITKNEWARLSAALLGALTQPNTVAILMGAEGLYSVLDAFSRSRALMFRRIKRYLFMLFACAVLVVPYVVSQRHYGRVHTLAEALQNPAFGKKGRQGELPFPEPVPQFANALVSPYAKAGQVIRPTPATIYKNLDSTGPLLVFTLLVLLVMARFAPQARIALAFYGATAVFYFLARYYAFRFYSPERYYSYGTPMAAVALAVTTIGLIGPKLSLRYRSAIRNFSAAGLIIFLCTFAGNGVVPRNGLYIDGRKDQKLYEFVGTLPKDIRIAAHPYDADDIPWWAGRATTGGLETFQVWLVEPWKRFEEMLHDTYQALYATDRRVVSDYCQRNKVTHFLLRRDRYGDDFKKKVALFEPITTYAEKLVAPLNRAQLVFSISNIPANAIIYQDTTWVLVDIQRMEQANLGAR